MPLTLPKIEYDLDNLDLLTKDEREACSEHVKALIKYAKGDKVSGILIRQLTAGAAVIAKKQQSRSAMAMLSWSMSQKTEGMDLKRISAKQTN